MIADLHVHTTFSDGSHTPSEAILEAKRRGLDCIALCDHDTTATEALATDYGLRVGEGASPFIFHRERRFVVAAANKPLLRTTLCDYVGYSRRFATRLWSQPPLPESDRFLTKE